MAKTSKELAALNIDKAVEKINANAAKRKTYDDRGTSGRDAGDKELAKGVFNVASTYERSKDMIGRYGKDAPKGRSFMAYEGQSGVAKKKGGGVVKMKEGSAKDMREDKAMAKKSGMSMKAWEKSAADKKHDAPKKMAGGGIVRGAGAAIRGKRYMGEC